MSVKDWADLNDNRFGPMLRELADAIEDCESPEMLYRVQRRLLYMSSATNSHRQRIDVNGVQDAKSKPKHSSRIK